MNDGARQIVSFTPSDGQWRVVDVIRWPMAALAEIARLQAEVESLGAMCDAHIDVLAREQTRHNATAARLAEADEVVETVGLIHTKTSSGCCLECCDSAQHRDTGTSTAPWPCRTAAAVDAHRATRAETTDG